MKFQRVPQSDLTILRYVGYPIVAVRSCVLFLCLSITSIATSGSAQQKAKSFARDRAAEEVVSKSLIQLLANQRITGLSRYQPALLSEGVCSSVLKGSWVKLMHADEAPSTFYQTDDISVPSNELRQMVIDTARHYKPMKRYAVAVWKENLPSGRARYWVGITLAKSEASDWFGNHLGADTPQEMASPNFDAKQDIAPECRHK
jgi:hypothetical protein